LRHFLFRGLLMKLSRFAILVFVLLLIVGATGCSLFGDKDKQESPAKIRETLEVPPDLARPQTGDLATGLPSNTAVYSTYSAKAPDTNKAPETPAPQSTVAPTPVPETKPENKTGVKLERDGAQRWLVVQDTPDHVAARVRRYLASQNMKLAIDDPKSGIFETEWEDRKVNLGSNAFTRILSAMQSTGFRDKYRIRIEAGREAGTSEVYVSQQGLEEVLTSAAGGVGGGPESAWQPRATDVQAETQMLSGIMTALGASDQQAKDQLGNAVAGGGATKAKDNLLLPQQDLDQAWRRVGQALDRSNFVIEDRDRHLGIYYVFDRAAAGAAKQGSLFGGWLKFGENTETIEDRLQVVLKTVEGGTSVKILNVKGERTESKNGEQLLDYLQKQLQ
jgi:outer membrane protein assembly factor BamC